jgi:hypothetical protein
LRTAAPPGLVPVTIVVSGERHPRPQPIDAEYVCTLDGDAGAVAAAVERYAEEEHTICERVSPKGRRTLDLKDYIVPINTETVVGGAKLRFTIHYREDGAARPQEFVDLIARWAGIEPAMRGLERLRVAWKGLPSGLDLGAGRSESP